jgi:hypothetical protein
LGHGNAQRLPETGAQLHLLRLPLTSLRHWF